MQGLTVLSGKIASKKGMGRRLLSLSFLFFVILYPLARVPYEWVIMHVATELQRMFRMLHVHSGVMTPGA